MTEVPDYIIDEQDEQIERLLARIAELEAFVNALNIQVMQPSMDGNHQCSVRANGRRLTGEQWRIILSCQTPEANE